MKIRPPVYSAIDRNGATIGTASTSTGEAKAVTEALRNEFAGKQRELAAQQTALKAKQEKYEKDGPTMSAEQRVRAEKELREGNRDYSQKLNDVQEDFNTRKGVERVIRFAFDLARKQGRKKVLMSDKSNVMTFAGGLWQRLTRSPDKAGSQRPNF